MWPAIRRGAASLASVLVVAAGAACTDGDDPQAPQSQTPVTISWVVPEDSSLRDFWLQVADEFTAAHPHVTVTVVAGHRSPPGEGVVPEVDGDLFEQWGGRELADQVDRGLVRDITDEVGAEVESLGGAVAGWRFRGRTYGLPYLARIEGFWYSKALFAAAGIGGTPSTIDDLNEAVPALRAAGVIPVAVDAQAGWPAVHYWYNFALRACSRDALVKSAEDSTFDDPCFVRAGEDLAAFLATGPFDEHVFDYEYQTTASYLLATERAAMWLSSSWALAELEQWQPVGDRFGWFPFPSTGGAGDPGDQLGGGEGFSCAASAPPECVDLLKYIVSTDVQRRLGDAGNLLPVAPGAAVADPTLAPMEAALHGTEHVQPWLDWAWEADVAQANTDAVMEQLRGNGTAQDVVSAMRAAAG